MNISALRKRNGERNPVVLAYILEYIYIRGCFMFLFQGLRIAELRKGRQ